MSKSEVKFQNTAKKMNSALIELLEEKEFSQITVLEVCKKANVNRSTFYSHYNNTYDLLEEVHVSFNKKLDKYFSTDDNELFKNDLSISIRNTASYLEFIKEHHFFFKAYMSNLNNFKHDEFYSSIKEKVLIPLLEKKRITNKTAVNYVAQFYLQGVAAIIKEWIYNDCSDDVDYISEMIILCMKLNLTE